MKDMRPRMLARGQSISKASIDNATLQNFDVEAEHHKAQSHRSNRLLKGGAVNERRETTLANGSREHGAGRWANTGDMLQAQG